jgi:hypothetical protein
MKKSLIIIFIFISLAAFSQSGKITLKFCPLALIDGFSFPAIQGGLEYQLTKRLSLYNEVGIKYRNSYFFEGADTSWVKSSGLKLKTECRYYFNKKSDDKDADFSKKAGRYLGVNLFYMKDWHNTEVYYYKNEDTSLYRTDNIGVKKNIFGLNILAGIQSHFPDVKNILFDVYAGFGIRFSNIDNVHQEYDPDKDEMLHPVDVSVSVVKKLIDTDQGFHTNFNLTCGFRVCYRF